MKKDLSKRFALIDTLRGFWLINMAAYHFLYDVFIVCGRDIHWIKYPGVIAWERCICVSFIALSGISLHFSKHPYRRGIIINLCGLLVTAVTYFATPSQAVWFGVLNLIGCSMLICAALRPLLNRVNAFAGLAGSVALFAVFYGVPERYIGLFNLKLLTVPDFFYQFKYVAFLGFPDSGFRSSDYFPIITWIFIFTAGYFLWRIIEQYNKQELFRRGVRPLSFAGRHSLLIYLLHQPVLYGLALLLFPIQ